MLNVLLAPLKMNKEGKVLSYLADTIFLEKTNHSTVSQAVIKVLQDYHIEFDNVICFDTDNAAYMKKAYKEVFCALFPNSIHITCLGHINGLVGEAYTKPFEALTEFGKKWGAIFYHAGARKARYLKHLKQEDPNNKATMAPNPCATRWNSWFKATQYHAKHFHLYKSFVAAEMKESKSPPPSLVWLNNTLKDKASNCSLKIQLDIISTKCQPVLFYIDYFQSRKPCTLKAFEALENLLLYFEANAAAATESLAEFFQTEQGDNLTLNERKNIIKIFKEANTLASQKLNKYVDENEPGQPGIKFLKQVRIFHPSKVPIMSKSVDDYQSIPGFDDVAS